MSYRRFCFTINNYTDEDIAAVEALDYKYLIYGRERAPTTNTPHLQCYVSLRKKTRFTTFRAMVPRAHVAICKGTHEENVVYCKKGGAFVEKGEVRQGYRTDLDGARQTALDGGMRAVTSAFSYQGIRTAMAFLTYNEPERSLSEPPTVWWFYGATGSGKTRAAKALVMGEDAYWKTPGQKWWDGYDAHDWVVFDDFRGSHLKFTHLLRILDSTPYQVECKGGNRQLLAKNFVFTSIQHPRYCYQLGSEEPVQQLMRRITRVEHVIELVPDDSPVPEEPVPEVEGNSRPPPLVRDRDWQVTYPQSTTNRWVDGTGWPSSPPYTPALVVDKEAEVPIDEMDLSS